MKIAIIGFAALVIGIGGGAFVSGSKVKAQILEAAALAHADSVSHAAGPDSTSHDPDGTAHEWLEDAIRFTVADTRYTAGVANLRARVVVKR